MEKEKERKDRIIITRSQATEDGGAMGHIPLNKRSAQLCLAVMTTMVLLQRVASDTTAATPPHEGHFSNILMK